MKAQKATGPMKTLLVALSVLSMLLTGLFVANSTQAGADPINCPDGFQLTEDEQSCFDHPVVVTRQGPVECEVGDLTPDKSACYTSVTFNTQSPTATPETIDATVTANASTVRCPANYNLVDGQCTTTVAQTDTVVGVETATGASTFSCADGTGPVNGQCTITTRTQTSPAVAAQAATCSGAAWTGTQAECETAVTRQETVCPAGSKEATGFTGCKLENSGTMDAASATAACPASHPLGPIPVAGSYKCFQSVDAVTNTIVVRAAGVYSPGNAAMAAQFSTTTTMVAATETPGATSTFCPVGTTPKNNGTACSTPRPAQTVSVAPQVIANPATVTCPPGYDGPTANNTCTRTILTAQPDVPTCTSGTLLDIGNGFVCLLDNAPVAPAPISGPECPRGEYDAKADLCFVTSTTGTHPGSITVVAKDAASAGGALAPAFTG